MKAMRNFVDKRRWTERLAGYNTWRNVGLITWYVGISRGSWDLKIGEDIGAD
jgi:hypothetical protein